MSNPAEKAKKMMNDRKGHCAQAVFTAFEEKLGKGKIDFDTMMQVSSAFSGGIVRTGNVCGAVTGALMVLGLKYGSPDSTKVNEVAKKFLDEFELLHSTVICRDLIKHDLITDEDVNNAFKTGAFDNCPKYVEDAVILLEKLL
jgi:C_GCAxxG_C_C family probable redox protein